MNFDKLPADIKRMIFDFNRAEAVERSKDNFQFAMHELRGMRADEEWEPDRTVSSLILENIRDYNDILNYDPPDPEDYEDFCREQQREAWRE